MICTKPGNAALAYGGGPYQSHGARVFIWEST